MLPGKWSVMSTMRCWPSKIRGQAKDREAIGNPKTDLYTKEGVHKREDMRGRVFSLLPGREEVLGFPSVNSGCQSGLWEASCWCSHLPPNLD